MKKVKSCFLEINGCFATDFSGAKPNLHISIFSKMFESLQEANNLFGSKAIQKKHGKKMHNTFCRQRNCQLYV